ncbi:CASP-like protein 1B2 [Linum grandiflorum]
MAEVDALRFEEEVEHHHSTTSIISSSSSSRNRNWIVMLRVAAFLATAAATIVMSLNKETKTFVVGTVGTTPVTASITAKFSHTPANVFFVIANAMASNHNLVMIGSDLLGLDYKGLKLPLVPVLDMLNAVLLSAGVNSAGFMAQLAKNGNSHARWNEVCDKFEGYCNRGGIAILASYVGMVITLVITVMSIVKLLKHKPKHVSSSPEIQIP